MQPFKDGFLILDKPIGITSAKAVAEVKKILGCKKIGHGGTLDPLASGILPLAIGEATKAFDYVANSIKEYRFTIRFGEERSTDDSEGEITAKTSIIPKKEEILNCLPEFMGTISQTPPIYSALKIDGERAYKRARAGEKIEMTPRPVEIHDLKFLEQPTIGEVTLSVTCGKGTYVRALARDISRKCNSLGYISMLRRTRVGKFNETHAILLDKLPQFMHNPALFKAWMPIELALDDIPAIDMDSTQALQLRQGKAISTLCAPGRYMALHQGHIVALVESLEGLLRSIRVFNIHP